MTKKFKPCGCLTDGRNWLPECKEHAEVRRQLKAAQRSGPADDAEPIRPRSFMAERLRRWQKQFHPDNETGELLQEAAAKIDELERASSEAGAERAND